MSEPVFYKDKWFLLSSGLVSWLQKFMEVFLFQFRHPPWFQDMIADLHWNFHVPHGKFFFDAEKIENDGKKIEYVIKMLDQVINKMESMNFLEFRDSIREAVKGSWCDFSSDNPIELTEELKKICQEKYIGSLRKLREFMQDNFEDVRRRNEF